MEIISSVKICNGTLRRISHDSSSTKTKMTFAVFTPPTQCLPTQGFPALYWLSGLTCTDENFSQKAGGFRTAASRGVAMVMPDTSPRGVTIEGADDSYDFGSGAGFYVDATEPKWKDNYQMYSYVTKELPEVLKATFRKVPIAMTRLRDEVDEFIEVDNDHPTQPRLRSPAHVRAFLRLARDVRDSPDERGSDSRGMSSLESWLPAAFSNGRAQGTGGSA